LGTAEHSSKTLDFDMVLPRPVLAVNALLKIDPRSLDVSFSSWGIFMFSFIVRRVLFSACAASKSDFVSLLCISSHLNFESTEDLIGMLLSVKSKLYLSEDSDRRWF
jgi:hypothetical protein